MSDKVLFSYHRDPRDPNRVVTLARRVKPGSHGPLISFQFAVCAPKRALAHVQHGKEFHGGVYIQYRDNTGDVFKKRRGREIALGRLDAHPIYVTGDVGDVHPLEAIRQYIVEDWDELFIDGPSFMHRIFLAETDLEH